MDTHIHNKQQINLVMWRQNVKTNEKCANSSKLQAMALETVQLWLMWTYNQTKKNVQSALQGGFS